MAQLDRKTLRESIRAQRREIDPTIRKTASERICRTMSQLQGFQQARAVAGFLAFEGEADPIELMRLAHEQQKRVFVPIIVAKGTPLQFAPWFPQAPMKLNFFGIAEPDIPPSDWVPANKLDFVICPLVGFDQWCNRLGVGAGYYDRTFAFLNHGHSNPINRLNRGTILAGFAFEMQRLPRIEAQPWDVPLDWIITERQIYRRSNKPDRTENVAVNREPSSSERDVLN